MMMVTRGAKRRTKPDLFISHSSRDKVEALRLSRTLNMCAIDVWLDDWEMETGQSLTDEIAKAMDDSRFIAILITNNYNRTVWTKTEYKRALAREQKEGRVVMLPIVVGVPEIPSFIEDKLYVDLRTEFFAGIVKLVALVHGITKYRVSEALAYCIPNSVEEVWRVLEGVGFNPYIVLGKDDFEEILKNGGKLKNENYATFDPNIISRSATVSKHVKELIKRLD